MKNRTAADDVPPPLGDGKSRVIEKKKSRYTSPRIKRYVSRDGGAIIKAFVCWVSDFGFVLEAEKQRVPKT